MQAIALKAKKRPTGKQEAKSIRRSGFVPGIFYFHGTENVPITVDPKEIRPVVFTAHSKMISLELEGEAPRQCVLRDVTFDPVTDLITHFDLIGIDPNRKMSFQVPISLLGQAIGVRMGGGLLQHNLRKVEIHCLPEFMPSSIDIDITNLEQGKHIQLKDIVLENAEFGLPLDTTVVSITTPRVTTKV
jgi:large subunit ribosomal protein L25